MGCRLRSRSDGAISLTLNAEVAEEKNSEEKAILFVISANPLLSLRILCYLCESSVISEFLSLD